MKTISLCAWILLLPAALPAETQPSAVVTAPSGLVLREEPDAASKSIGLLPKGTNVTLLTFKTESVTIGGVEGRWVRVQHQVKTGWCFSGYLSAVSSVDPSFRKRLVENLWGPIHGWGMFTRFHADGTFDSNFQGEGTGEAHGLFSVLGPDRISLNTIEAGEQRLEGLDNVDCTFRRDTDSVFKEWLLDCGSHQYYDTTSIVPAGQRRRLSSIPAVTMGAAKAKTTTRVRIRQEPNTASKELECGGYGTPTVPYADTNTDLSVFARTEKKEKVQNWTNYWYFVDAHCHILPVHGWVFGEFVQFER